MDVLLLQLEFQFSYFRAGWSCLTVGALLTRPRRFLVATQVATTISKYVTIAVHDFDGLVEEGRN